MNPIRRLYLRLKYGPRSILANPEHAWAYQQNVPTGPFDEALGAPLLRISSSKPLRCRLGLHRMGTWASTGRTRLAQTYHTPLLFGHATPIGAPWTSREWTRACTCCGDTERTWDGQY